MIDIKRVLPSLTQISKLIFFKSEKNAFSPLKLIVNTFISAINLTFVTNGKIVSKFCPIAYQNAFYD